MDFDFMYVCACITGGVIVYILIDVIKSTILLSLKPKLSYDELKKRYSKLLNEYEGLLEFVTKQPEKTFENVKRIKKVEKEFKQIKRQLTNHNIKSHSKKCVKFLKHHNSQIFAEKAINFE